MLFWKCKFRLIWFFSSKFPLFNLLKLHALCMASYNNDIFKLFLKALDIVSSNTGHLPNVPDQPVSILCLKLLNIFFLYWKEVKCYVLIICKNSPKMLTLNSKSLISMMLYFSWPLMWAWCVSLCYWMLTLSSLFWALICSRSRPALLMQWVRH